MACVINILLAAAMQEPGPDGMRRSRWAVVRSSYRYLKSTTLKTWFDWVPSHMGNLRQADSPMTHHIMIGDIDLEVMFFPLRDEDDVSALLSLELTGCWFNECREVPFQIIKDAMGRCGRFPPKRDVEATYPMALMDTNPPGLKHWIPTMYAEKCKQFPDEYKYFIQPSGRGEHAENVDNLPTNYYQNLVRDNDPEWCSVYVDGNDGDPISADRIYKKFKPDIHIKNDLVPVKEVPIDIGVDIGLSPGVVFGQELPNGSWMILDELTGADYHIQDLCNAVRMKWDQEFRGHAPGKGTFDPAGKARNPLSPNLQTSWQLLEQFLPMFNWQPAYTNNPFERWQAVNNLLGRVNGIVVGGNCSMLIDGFNGGYKFRKTRGGEILELAEKNEYSNPHDALQYLILGGAYSAFEVPRESQIWTPDEDLQLEVPRY